MYAGRDKGDSLYVDGISDREFLLVFDDVCDGLYFLAAAVDGSVGESSSLCGKGNEGAERFIGRGNDEMSTVPVGMWHCWVRTKVWEM